MCRESFMSRHALDISVGSADADRMSASTQESIQRAYEGLRLLGLSFPEATEDHPWGETALKVKGKVFVFMSLTEKGLSLSTKLPESNALALELPFAKPTGYGLGKSGWVSARFTEEDEDEVPTDILRAWIEESYRAVAPKKLSALMIDSSVNETPKKRSSAPLARRKAVSKKR
jgi:predicted DNA-binding protein (MmcQ/YjbR family)